LSLGLNCPTHSQLFHTIYDAAGNQTKALLGNGISQKYKYDQAGRLVKVKDDLGNTITTYTYGVGRQRLITQDGSESSNLRTYYMWDGGSVATEYTENDGASTTPSWQKNYVYMGGRLLSTIETGGYNSSGQPVERIYYHHADRLGTRLVTNSANTSYFEQATLPYGTALDAESSGATNRRFTSYDRSVITGLDYAVNRFYDSTEGRFTQVDPKGMGAVSRRDPQTLNMYSYTANDPINRLDPNGLDFGFGGGGPQLTKGIGGGSGFRWERPNLGPGGTPVFNPGAGSGIGGRPSLPGGIFGPGGTVGINPGAGLGLGFAEGSVGLPSSNRLMSAFLSVLASAFQGGGRPVDNCRDMAKDAQRMANDAMDGRNNYAALKHFNKSFSRKYTGKAIGDGPLGMADMAMGGSSDQKRADFGQRGFHPRFRDSVYTDDSDDQTHHFAAYFSGGISGHKNSLLIHRQFDRDNPGDLALADQAEALGTYIRENPGELQNVGKHITETICEGKAVPQ
jgi:RHS repeat-associated protein